MPRHTLTYTVEEIEKLVSEDAVRRGFVNVTAIMESFTPSRAALLQQAGLYGRTKPYVRAVVTADNVKEDLNGNV